MPPQQPSDLGDGSGAADKSSHRRQRPAAITSSPSASDENARSRTPSYLPPPPTIALFRCTTRRGALRIHDASAATAATRFHHPSHPAPIPHRNIFSLPGFRPPPPPSSSSSTTTSRAGATI
ncbi:hypothetical protein V9T40_012542 [Parthenolecanium corni]|uniref:Uncharacterized protein n=1 Tax=Parthenolecanium corni TaxID=536013 RepID=A0AAN9XZ78_9HEMI